MRKTAIVARRLNNLGVCAGIEWRCRYDLMKAFDFTVTVQASISFSVAEHFFARKVLTLYLFLRKKLYNAVYGCEYSFKSTLFKLIKDYFSYM